MACKTVATRSGRALVTDTHHWRVFAGVLVTLIRVADPHHLVFICARLVFGICVVSAWASQVTLIHLCCNSLILVLYFETHKLSTVTQLWLYVLVLHL